MEQRGVGLRKRSSDTCWRMSLRVHQLKPQQVGEEHQSGCGLNELNWLGMSARIRHDCIVVLISNNVTDGHLWRGGIVPVRKQGYRQRLIQEDARKMLALTRFGPKGLRVKSRGRLSYPRQHVGCISVNFQF